MKVMPTVFFSWVMLSMVVGVAADSRGRNPAWLLLALVISPLLAAPVLLALPNLKTDRQWQPFIQMVIGWCRRRNSKGAGPHVNIGRRDPNSRSDRLLDPSACASVLGRYPSLSMSVERWTVSNPP